MTEDRPINRQRRWQLANPAARAAHDIVAAARRRGALSRPECCEQCGATGRLDAHHPDYGRPLVVQFLCRRCHATRHSWGRKRRSVEK